jgi:pimeloyl-ACP methyl ester carboxylesterase
MQPERFSLKVDDEVLDDLKHRLESTRWSPEINNSDWKNGMKGVYMRDLAAYWLEGYDWRAQEAEINSFSHFRVELAPGVPVHFIHEKGKGPNPVPIVLTHGWPWTFWDWNEVIRPLADPASYGGDPADAFDVIVPSMPGYALSSPLTVGGVTAEVIADLWHKLMHDVLGYDRFGAAGGDWGSFVTWELGTRYVPSMLGVYLSFPPLWHAGGMSSVRAEDYGPGEEDWFERSYRGWNTTMSHMHVHSHDHQTLAWALNDSPLGLAAWLLERRRNWSDCHGDLGSVFSTDFLLTTVMLYWTTQTIASSMQLYAEQYGAEYGALSASPAQDTADAPPRIEAPTGIGVYPAEVVLLPRATCEKAANLVHWSVLEKGGHFAPSEVPRTYVEELRTFYRPLRS